MSEPYEGNKRLLRILLNMDGSKKSNNDPSPKEKDNQTDVEIEEEIKEEVKEECKGVYQDVIDEEIIKYVCNQCFLDFRYRPDDGINPDKCRRCGRMYEMLQFQKLCIACSRKTNICMECAKNIVNSPNPNSFDFNCMISGKLGENFSCRSIFEQEDIRNSVLKIFDIGDNSRLLAMEAFKLMMD